MGRLRTWPGTAAKGVNSIPRSRRARARCLASGPSRLAFNVYEAGHWVVHVTAPGATSDSVTLKDWFLWDIRDLEGDGVEDWVMSPVRDSTDPDTSGWYFVKWRTVLARWQESSSSVEQTREIQGAIPYLVGAFREARRTTSRGFLYPSLTVGSRLVLVDAAKQHTQVQL